MRPTREVNTEVNYQTAKDQLHESHVDFLFPTFSFPEVLALGAVADFGLREKFSLSSLSSLSLEKQSRADLIYFPSNFR